MLLLRVQRCELTYEAALSSLMAVIIDTPGKLVPPLLSELSSFGVALVDIRLDEGTLEDRGLSCDIDQCNSNVLVRADRFEVRFFDVDENEDAREGLIRGVWQALNSVSRDV